MVGCLGWRAHRAAVRFWRHLVDAREFDKQLKILRCSARLLEGENGILRSGEDPGPHFLEDMSTKIHR